jgi:hypothetical protein
LRFGLLAFAVVFLVVIPEGDLLLLPFFDLHLPKHSSSRPEQQTVSSSVAQWRNPCILLFALAVAFLVCHPRRGSTVASVFDLHLPKHSSSRPEQQTVSSSVAQWRNPCILLFALAIAFLVVIPEGDLLLLLSSPSPFSCHPSPQREDLPLSSRSGRVAYI